MVPRLCYAGGRYFPSRNKGSSDTVHTFGLVLGISIKFCFTL